MSQELYNGNLIYRCKLCGELSSIEFSGSSLPAHTVLHITLTGQNAKLGPVFPHECEDGRIGIAELIGAEPYAIVSPTEKQMELFKP